MNTKVVRFGVAAVLASLFSVPSRADDPGTAKADATPVPIADFARHAEYRDAEISPNGDYLALTKRVKGRIGLVIVDLKQMKVTASIATADGVFDFWWVGPNRIVIEPAITIGSLEAPRGTGELLGVNVDGSHEKYLFGPHAEESVGSRLTGRAFANAYAWMVDPLPDDPKHALIAVQSYESQLDASQTVYELDVDTGARKVITGSPAPFPEFETDHHGQVRYVVAKAPNLDLITYVRDLTTDKWQPLAKTADWGVLTPLGFSKDDRTVYLSGERSDGSGCLIGETLADGAMRPVACSSAGQALRRVIFALDRSEPIAVVMSKGRPMFGFLPTTNPDRALFKNLLQQHPGAYLRPVSATRDGSKAILLVTSDRDPGQFLLLDRANGTAKNIITRRSWIDPNRMAEQRPFDYASRDGTPIHAYLTLPPGKPEKNLPLVVIPHGGPFGISDTWDWDHEGQLLASRGYAVLQPNYRGSSGYGTKFIDLGIRQWGKGMIDDIVDGTRAVVAQGFADPARLCIFGASYGGYAALMSAVREPDLYKCVVAFAGPYDLNVQVASSDTARLSWGRKYLQENVCADQKECADQSPLTYIDKLKAAIMIVHGGKDERVPVSQAEALRAALDQRKYPYEWLVKGGEGHGFDNEEDRIELYTKLIEFLDKNIGARPSGG